jgi:hypothetical protein
VQLSREAEVRFVIADLTTEGRRDASDHRGAENVSVSDDYSWRRACSAATNCVEVAAAMVQVAVRNSKDPDGPVLRFPRGEWRGIVDELERVADSGHLDGGGRCYDCGVMPERLLRLLAAPFAQHPDFDPAWAVEGTVTT